MVASDGQEIIGMIINHLLRSACAVDLKTVVIRFLAWRISCFSHDIDYFIDTQ